MRIDEVAGELSLEIMGLTGKVRALMRHDVSEADAVQADVGEMKANIMLAVRHLEDANARLGMMIDAFNVRRGVSNA